MKKIKIFINKTRNYQQTLNILTRQLAKHEFMVVSSDYDLGIAIGGDGSFLNMIKEASFNSEVSYVGINTGTLGFLQEVRKNEIDNFVTALIEENYRIDEIGIQETTVYGNKKNKFYSLNEIIIRDKNLKTISLQLNVEDKKLEDFVGDGILIATSVGSTAHNLSFGGSIVYDSFHTLQITPIAPLNNKEYCNLTNSVIIPENRIIEILPKNKEIMITSDGESEIYTNVTSIETVVDKKRIKCLRWKDYDFTSKINEKFLQR